MRPVSCPRATYQRRQLEQTVLYRTIAAHLPAFLARPAGEDGTGGWPGFVRREFEAYLRCGILEHGWAVTPSVRSPPPVDAIGSQDHAAASSPPGPDVRGGARWPARAVIRAVDGVVMRLPRAWTDADGLTSGGAGADAVFTVEAIRALVELVEALRGRRDR